MFLKRVFKWVLVLAVVAGLIGSTAALFLWALDAATRQRFATPWLIYLLPVAGVVMGFYYRHIGKRISSGNHLILGNVHAGKDSVPFSLAPSIIIATCGDASFRWVSGA